MGFFGWIAISVALALVVGALRAGAQIQPREYKPNVVQALPPTPTPVPTRTPTHAPAYWDAARTVTKNALNSWIASADVRGKVKGTAWFVDGEWLVNTHYDMKGAIHDGLRQAGAPEDAANAFAAEVTEGWKTWIRGYKTTNPAAFPLFAAFPGSTAPPTPALVPSHRLRLGISTADRAMGTDLAGKIKGRLPNQSADGPAIDAFASWLSGRFQAWYGDAYLKDLSGSGPVPSFAPPYVPGGPVDGTLTGHVGSPAQF